MNSTAATYPPPSRPHSSATAHQTHLPVHPNSPQQHLQVRQLPPAATAVVRQSSQGSSVFDDFHGSESASSSTAPSAFICQPLSAAGAHQQIIGENVQQQQHRSSWANLVNFGGEDGRTKLAKTFRPSSSTLMAADPPPPYDQFQIQQQHGGSHQMTKKVGASRQSSNASGGTLASSPFSFSKGSPSSFFQLVEPGHPPPFPLMAAPYISHHPPQFRPHSGAGGGRSASALSSNVGQGGGGGRLSSGTGSSRRELQPRKKRDRMQELRDLWARPGCRLCCLATLLLLIGLLIALAILTSHLALPQHLEFAWFAPEQFRTGQLAGGGTSSSPLMSATTAPAAPNRARLDVGQHGQQVRLELSGAQPFRSNFISVLDFKTNQVAIVDLSLRSGQRNSICFVMDLDRQNIHDIEALLRAAKNGAERKNQLHGWEESWLWSPQPLSQSPVFQPEVAECRGARWVQLVRTGTDQKGQKCTECFDFCLPDWGIDSDAIRDQQYLNIVRRICFSLFVPEWRPYAQSLGWQQNQHDFEQFYRRQQQQGVQQAHQQQNQQPNIGMGMGQPPPQMPLTMMGGGGGGGVGAGIQQPQNMETKWISLQTPPPHIPSVQNAGGLPPNQQSQTQKWPSPPFAPSSSSAGGGPHIFSPQIPPIWPWGQQQSANLGAGGGGDAIGANSPQMPSMGNAGGSAAAQWPPAQPQAQQWPSAGNLPQQFTSEVERQSQQRDEQAQRWRLMRLRK